MAGRLCSEAITSGAICIKGSSNVRMRRPSFEVTKMPTRRLSFPRQLAHSLSRGAFCFWAWSKCCILLSTQGKDRAGDTNSCNPRWVTHSLRPPLPCALHSSCSISPRVSTLSSSETPWECIPGWAHSLSQPLPSVIYLSHIC